MQRAIWSTVVLATFVAAPVAAQQYRDADGQLRLHRPARIGCSQIFQAQLKAAGA